MTPRLRLWLAVMDACAAAGRVARQAARAADRAHLYAIARASDATEWTGGRDGEPWDEVGA